jgi:hypothetical protein
VIGVVREDAREIGRRGAVTRYVGFQDLGTHSECNT